MSARYETPFTIELDRAQTVYLVPHGGSREELTVQIADSRIEAGWPLNDTFDHPPRFTGRIEARADGALVTGTIREAWSNRAWARIWAIPTVAMAAVAVLGLVLVLTRGGHVGAPGLVIGVVGGVLFALMWRWQTSLRRPTYDHDARALVAGLTRYLTTGDGTRRG